MRRTLTNVLGVVLFLAASVQAQPATRTKRWLGGWGGYGAYDIGYAYGWQVGEIIACIVAAIAFFLCICCPCICFLGIWFAGWFGIREKRRRPRDTVQLSTQVAPPPQVAPAPTIIQQNPPPIHYSGGPPPLSHGEPTARGQYVYAQDRYYERRNSPNREKYYR